MSQGKRKANANASQNEKSMEEMVDEDAADIEKEDQKDQKKENKENKENKEKNAVVNKDEKPTKGLAKHFVRFIKPSQTDMNSYSLKQGDADTEVDVPENLSTSSDTFSSKKESIPKWKKSLIPFAATYQYQKDPFEFLKEGHATYGDLFRFRLLATQITPMKGFDAALLFYTDGLTERDPNYPPTLRDLLSAPDRPSLMALNGDVHHFRKQTWLQLLKESNLQLLMQESLTEWKAFFADLNLCDVELQYSPKSIVTKSAFDNSDGSITNLLTLTKEAESASCCFENDKDERKKREGEEHCPIGNTVAVILTKVMSKRGKTLHKGKTRRIKAMDACFELMKRTSMQAILGFQIVPPTSPNANKGDKNTNNETEREKEKEKDKKRKFTVLKAQHSCACKKETDQEAHETETLDEQEMYDTMFKEMEQINQALESAPFNVKCPVTKYTRAMEMRRQFSYQLDALFASKSRRPCLLSFFQDYWKKEQSPKNVAELQKTIDALAQEYKDDQTIKDHIDLRAWLSDVGFIHAACRGLYHDFYRAVFYLSLPNPATYTQEMYDEIDAFHQDWNQKTNDRLEEFWKGLFTLKKLNSFCDELMRTAPIIPNTSFAKTTCSLKLGDTCIPKNTTTTFSIYETMNTTADKKEEQKEKDKGHNDINEEEDAEGAKEKKEREKEWDELEVFKSDRYENRPVSSWSLEEKQWKWVPMGAGDPNVSHRCLGENLRRMYIRLFTYEWLRKVKWQLVRDQDFTLKMDSIVNNGFKDGLLIDIFCAN